MTPAEWRTEGTALFGTNSRAWRFVCPVCKSVMSVQDYFDVGAPEGFIGFSCIGRYLTDANASAEVWKKMPAATRCTYAGGGLFKLHPIMVISVDGNEVPFFDFDRSTPLAVVPEQPAGTVT